MSSDLDELISRSSELVVAGRTFRPVTNTTFKQDIYIMSVQKKSGMDKIAGAFTDATKLDEAATEIIVEAFANGKLFEMLGAVLTEDGVEWSVDRAKANAEFFANLTDPSDKKALYGSIVSVLMSFFVSGVLSSQTSLKSLILEPRDDSAPESSDAAPSAEEPRTTESGTTSSGTSQDMITSAPNAS